MNRRSLGIIAIFLIALMAFIATAGLDSLPRELRASATTSVTQAAADRSQFESDRSAVEKALAAEPALFASRAAQWRTQLAAAEGKLKDEEAQAAKLKAFAEANRRQDAEAVSSTLRQLESARTQAQSQAKSIRAEVEKWLGYKQRTPQLLTEMKERYESIRAFNPETTSAMARKAAVDWPAKADDLNARLNAMSNLKSGAETTWGATAAVREKAEAGDYASVDYGALIGADESLGNTLQQLTSGADALNKLAAQLYVSWDKVLLDLDDDDGNKQKVRVVQTKYPDASLQNGQVSQDERWENVTASRFSGLAKSVGMVVERKPAGKFDNEAEQNIQAPGYAYIAPPGQSNQYGSWNNGVWSWLPQYLILSQLLRGPSYPPVRMDDWSSYDRHRRSGGTWYGRDGSYGREWGRYRDRGLARGGSTSGWRRMFENWTSSKRPEVSAPSEGRRRETWTWGGKSGSFGDSRYRSRGSFGGSRYQSRPSSGFGSRSYSRGFGGGRSFGRGGRR
jgi:hypothetical protein